MVGPLLLGDLPENTVVVVFYFECFLSGSCLSPACLGKMIIVRMQPAGERPFFRIPIVLAARQPGSDLRRLQEKRLCGQLFGVFSMFVPSLSWQIDRFDVKRLSKRPFSAPRSLPAPAPTTR